MYTRYDFGKELLVQINKEFDPHKIAKWAHEKYLDNCVSLDKETYSAMMLVIAMDEGDEFLRSKEELVSFANRLTNEK